MPAPSVTGSDPDAKPPPSTLPRPIFLPATEAEAVIKFRGSMRLTVFPCLRGSQLAEADERRRGCVEGAGGLELSTRWVPLSSPLLRGLLRADRPCVTDHERKANQQINRLCVLKDFSFLPFVYLNFFPHNIWVMCGYNQGLCKHRKAWTPSPQGMDSYCFTMVLDSRGQKSHGSFFCCALYICYGLHCVPHKFMCSHPDLWDLRR